MPVVVKRADDLLAAIDEVASAVALQRRPREMLDEIRKDAQGIRERLVDLHENWCALHVAPQLTLKPAREQWRALPPGRRPGADPDVAKLLQVSPTLDAMHKGGVDLLSFYKFDAERCALASTIGDAFRDWQFCWDRFKNGLARGESKFELQAQDFEAARGFLDAMIRAEVIASYETWMYSHRDKGWDQINPKRIRHLNPRQPIGIKFDLIKGGLSSFVGGDWLTAYAFQIIDDHLSRNDFDYEIYTQVRYEAPPDVLRVSGDFDVLTRAGQKALLIEC